MGTVYLAEHGTGSAGRTQDAPPQQGQGQTRRRAIPARPGPWPALNHPNIIKVFDVFHSGGIYFMAMEYAEGKDLGTLLKETGAMHLRPRLATSSRRLPASSTLTTRGSSTDIKPDNLILAKDGAETPRHGAGHGRSRSGTS